MSKVRLTAPQWEEMAFVRLLWGDPETMRPVGGPHYMDEDQAKAWFERMVDPGNPENCFRLIFTDQDEPVGEISYHRFDRVSGTALFNIKVLKSEQGKGYARSAMTQFLNNFFNEVGGECMIDDVGLENRIGQEVLLRFGFFRNPTYSDVCRLQITRAEFNRRYGQKTMRGSDDE
jgi:RimJ/RimL family protein N-acetyltransferase